MSILDRAERLAWDYDEEAAVLYVSIAKPRKATGVDIGQVSSFVTTRKGVRSWG